MKKYAVITMDVEDWYHTYFTEVEVNRNISLLDGLDVALNIMNQKKIKGSFFVVAELADVLAEKLKDMDAHGHDIACHNWTHSRPLSMTIEEYKEQLVRAKNKLEQILGHEVVGYRAPSFAIDDEHFDIMRSCGFKYDSSKIKKQKSTKYGSLGLKGFEEVFPCVFRKNDFIEFEVSTQKIADMNMLLGGGYLRMLPWVFIKRMIKKYIKTGRPYIMYIHPIDLSLRTVPKVNGISADRYLRTHIGRKKMIDRFVSIIEMLEENGYEFVTLEWFRNSVLNLH